MSTKTVTIGDRYGGVIATKLTNKDENSVDPKEIPSVIAGLRKAFNSDKTLSKEWRIGQLNALLRLCTEDRNELRKGMKLDLHKSSLEGDLTEIDLVVSEIHLALDELDEWMTPVSTSSSALNIPCKSEVKCDPLGVVLIMGAWNYPVQLTLAPLVGAIAAGNCVFIKPGSYAVESSHILTKLITKHMDQECIRVAEGNRDVTNALLAEKFDKIFFTGSTFVGKLIAEAAAKTLTPVVLELGGKSPTIVDKSADIDHAAKRIVWGSFMNSGQTCVRPDFGLIHEDIADEFFRTAAKCVKQFYSENPQKTEYFGRIINDASCKKLCDLQKTLKDKAVNGECRQDLADKYVEPTIFDFGKDMNSFIESPIMKEETFGPLFPCYRYKNTEEAVQIIRNIPTGKPLALYAFGTDPKFIEAITDRTTAGGMVVNDCLMHLANHELPFGGVGNSGMGGGYHGRRTFVQFSHEKAVLTKYSGIDQLAFVKPLLELRFPPYDSQIKQTLLPILGNPFVGKVATLQFPWIRKFLMALVAYIIFRGFGLRIARD